MLQHTRAHAQPLREMHCMHQLAIAQISAVSQAQHGHYYQPASRQRTIYQAPVPPLHIHHDTEKGSGSPDGGGGGHDGLNEGSVVQWVQGDEK